MNIVLTNLGIRGETYIELLFLDSLNASEQKTNFKLVGQNAGHNWTNRQNCLK